MENGLKRKKKVNNVRQQSRSDVDCPEQNHYYSTTFHLIDKGNQNEAKYDISLKSNKHGWSPKLALRLFNMNLNNAYKIYEWLVVEYTPERRFLCMGEAVKEAAHALLQKGPPMRMQSPEHPLPLMNLGKLWNPGSGRKKRTDAKGEIAPFGRTRLGLEIRRYLLLKRRQKVDTWHLHQSVTSKTKGRCAYAGCPNLRFGKAVRKRTYATHRHCEECSAKKKKPIYFCNDKKKGGKVVNCHMKYHCANHSKKKI